MRQAKSGAASRIDDVLSQLAELPLNDMAGALEKWPADKLAALQKSLRSKKRLWVPNPGAQTQALTSPAEELFMGGEPGGGKSSLLIGAAITEHQRAVIFRREFPQVKGLEDEAARILGSRAGYNATTHVWRVPNTKCVLEFGSVPHESDKEKHQGRARDYFGFDELTHFSRSQYRYLTLWLRSADPKQRKRIIATGNPPQTAEGLWVIEHWAPWLDETFHDPAEPGELRWAAPMDDESDRELFFRSVDAALEHIETLAKPPRDHEGEIIPPRSRTFIPSKLEENPDYARSGYAAVLGYAAKKDRDLAQGKFKSILEDGEFQVVPTAWIIAAQERWRPDGWKDFAMTAMAFDPAGGGRDSAELAWRYGGWFAPLVSTQGKETADGSLAAAKIIEHRRDAAPVVVDVGGGAGHGFGGTTIMRLKDNGVPVQPFNGAGDSMGRTRDKQMRFANKRAEAWWKFREELDPDQQGGSVIALPPDPELRADLAAPAYEVGARGILIEDKREIRKRIGRSPGKGDAVVMCLSEGNAAIKRGLGAGSGRNGPWQRPANKVGHANQKKRR